MKLSPVSVLWSGLVALFQATIVTYITQTPQPQSFQEMISFHFVMSVLVMFSGNAALANANFRNPNARTREQDDNPSIIDIIKKGK